MFEKVRLDFKVYVAPIARYGDYHADRDREEHEPCLSEIEAVHTNVHERKGFKE